MLLLSRKSRRGASPLSDETAMPLTARLITLEDLLALHGRSHQAVEELTVPVAASELFASPWTK